MARPKNDKQKEKFHLALTPKVHKKLRLLAVEHDLYPGDIIEGLLKFSESYKLVDDPGYQELFLAWLKTSLLNTGGIEAKMNLYGVDDEEDLGEAVREAIRKGKEAEKSRQTEEE